MSSLPLYFSFTINDKLIRKETIKFTSKNDCAFISLHVLEDVNETYVKETIKLCNFLNKFKLKIIADISPKTLDIFKCKDFYTLSKTLHIYAFRPDYGFSLNQIINLAKKMPLAVNASTMDIVDIKKIIKVNKDIIAIHNFYPRPETGLDILTFSNKTKEIKSLGIPVYAFINSNINLRGPIFKGLPTLELSRMFSPITNYISFDKLNIVDGLFVGDLGISEEDYSLIKNYQTSNIIPLKVNIEDHKLLGRVFTNRVDSPITLIRIKESREYASKGNEIKPKNCIKRSKGSITIDNINYLRYSGEIMITKVDLPKDAKVNVIGNVDKDSLGLLNFISGGEKFKFYK